MASAVASGRARDLAGQAAIVAAATLLLGGVAAAMPPDTSATADPDGGITVTSVASAFVLAPGKSVTWPVRVDAPDNGWTSLQVRLSVLQGAEDPFARTATVRVRQCTAVGAEDEPGTLGPTQQKCRTAPSLMLESVVLQDVSARPVALGASPDSILLLIDVELPAGAAVLGSSAEIRVDLLASDSRDSVGRPPAVTPPESGLARTGIRVLPMALLGVAAVLAGICLARTFGRPRKQPL